MTSLVIYFFLLVLGVLLNLTPDIIHKYSKFFKAFFEKGLKFVSDRRSGLITIDLSLMLLPAEVDPILEE